MIKVIRSEELQKEKDFDETEHPRDDSGKFAPKGEGAATPIKADEKKHGEERKMPKRIHLGGGRIMSITKPEPEPEKVPEVTPAPDTGKKVTVTHKPMKRVEAPKKVPTTRDLPKDHWTTTTTGTYPDWDTANAILSVRGKGVRWKQTGDFEWEATSPDLPGKFVISKIMASMAGTPHFYANYVVDGKAKGISGISTESKEKALSDFANGVQEGIDKKYIKKPVAKPEDPHTGWYKEPTSYFETPGLTLSYEAAKHVIDGYDADKEKMFAKKDSPGSRDREDETIFIVPIASRTHRAHFKVWHFVNDDGESKYYARYFENGTPIGDGKYGDTAADAVESYVSEVRNDLSIGRIAPPKKIVSKPSALLGYGRPFSDKFKNEITRLASADGKPLDWTAGTSYGTTEAHITHGDPDFSGDCYFRAGKFTDEDGKDKYLVRFYDDYGYVGDPVEADSPDEGAQMLIDQVKEGVAAGKFSLVDYKERVEERKKVTEEIKKKKEPLFRLVGAALHTVTSFIDRQVSELGVSKEEAVKEIEKNMTTLVKDKPIYKRLDHRDFAHVLSDPEMRFKTLFETRTGHGCTDTGTRADGESRGMGIPKDVDPRLRPVYGYIDKGSKGSEALGYGEIAVKFKPHVRNRTTFTLGDSLGPMCSSALAPAPVNKPDYRAADSQVHNIYAGTHIRGYIETQIHGGATMDEVEEVIFYSRCFSSPGVLMSPHAALEKRLKKLGFKVTYDESSY